MARLLIECTRTASSGLHTGIQRVVRRLTAEAQKLVPNHGFDSVISVLIDADGWYALPALMPHSREAGGIAASTRFETSSLVSSPLSPPTNPSINPSISPSINLPLSPLTIQPDDHLLLVDATWYLDAWPALHQAIDSGAQLHVIWHDLIPLQHPEFFPHGLATRFQRHLDQVIQHASSIQCVSATVRAQLAHYIHSTAPHKINTLTLGVQHPGADGLQSGMAPREALLAMWPARQTIKGDANSPLRLLAVGTLEPRKGHAVLLDACEAIWRDADASPAAHDLVLCIAGAPGWQVDALLARLHNHPERGRRLFVFNDLSDAELDWCYTHASCLVYPSFAEGYGLPIAEAGWRGLPVLLSDTEIHREVAGPKARYFAPRSAAALAQTLRQCQTSAQFFDTGWPEPGRFRSWRHMTNTLMQSLQQTSQNPKVYHEPHHSPHH